MIVCVVLKLLMTHVGIHVAYVNLRLPGCNSFIIHCGHDQTLTTPAEQVIDNITAKKNAKIQKKLEHDALIATDGSVVGSKRVQRDSLHDLAPGAEISLGNSNWATSCLTKSNVLDVKKKRQRTKTKVIKCIDSFLFV